MRPTTLLLPLLLCTPALAKTPFAVRDAASREVLLDASAIAAATASGKEVDVTIRPSALAAISARPDLVGRKLEVMIHDTQRLQTELKELAALAHIRFAEQSAKSAVDRATELQALSPCVELVSGRRVGTYSVGTRLMEQAAVEPDALAGWMRPKEAAGKQTRLRFDAKNILVEVDAPLPTCVRTPNQIVDDTDARVLAATLGTCGMMDVREGGNLIPCAGVVLNWSGSGPVRARVQAATAIVGAPCATYVDSGEWVDKSGVHGAKEPVELDVAKVGAVCVLGGKAPVTPSTRIQDVSRTGCREDARRGGVHLVCPMATYSFGGPTAILTTVTVPPSP